MLLCMKPSDSAIPDMIIFNPPKKCKNNILNLGLFNKIKNSTKQIEAQYEISNLLGFAPAPHA